MSIAGSKELAGDFERATQDLIKAPRLRALFPHLKPEGRRGNLYMPHGGQRISGVVGGVLVGRGADLIVIDDPIAPARAQDDQKRRAVNTWFDAEVIQRLNDKKTGRVVVVMQRLHHDDLCGHLLSGEQPWAHLNLPAIATKDEEWKLSRGGVFTRNKGEPLAPAIDSKATLYARMLDIGAYNFGAQYQQKPFEHMNDEEARGGCFALPDDERGPNFYFGTVRETAIMAHEVFGVGDFHPATPPRRLSENEWRELFEDKRDPTQPREEEE
jgi:hypothetical protein